MTSTCDRRWYWAAATALVIGCGNGSGRDDASGDGGINSISDSNSAGPTSGNEPSGGAMTENGGGSMGGSMGVADGTESDSDGLPKFDVGAPDGGVSCGDMGDGETHSFIWIANSSQGTVSKINTQTMVEEGRYRVRPDSAGNPSRTSVSLSGDVAVANRAGGVVKIYSFEESCQDTNGMPGIQTSTSGADLLDWGMEECVAWYTPFDYTTQRPVAWAQGTLNPATCAYEDEKLWTAGRYGAGNADVLLLDGETGVVEDMAVVSNVIGWAGLYGGAVDGAGNFWTVDHNWNGPSTLVRVDRQTMAVDTWPVVGQVHYGLAVDAMGRPWLCGGGGASRFDPATQMWAHLAPSGAGSELGGCMTDGAGTLWHSRYNSGALLAIDTETLNVVDEVVIPAYVHGVSIDFDGNVWGVQFNGNSAYRVDPVTHTVDTFSGLVGAYTYSDMTGFALSAAGVPQG